MLPIKPLSELWVIGDAQLCRGWFERMSTVGKVAPGRCILWEDEANSFLLHFILSGLSRLSGVILITWFREPLSVYQRALLSLANQCTSHFYVLLCNTHESHQYRRDREISLLREELSGVGFSGDETPIFLESGLFPSPETLSALLDALSQRSTLERPRHFDAKEKALELLRGLIRPAALLTPVPDSPQRLYESPIDTQLGGYPYIEDSAEWPVCLSCRSAPMGFVGQVSTDEGLYTIYSCVRVERHPNSPPIEVKYYPAPSKERRLPRQTSLFSFSSTGVPVTPCAFLRAEGSLLPSARDVLEGASPDVLPLQVILQSMADDDSDAGESQLYEGLCREVGVAPVSFSFGASPIHVGGYSDDPSWEPHLTDVCASCGRLLETLIHLHWVVGVNFPWRYNALQFFRCRCTPSAVVHKIIVGDEPYM
jgi:hypothetical protein